jgi:hypothetical protein
MKQQTFSFAGRASNPVKTSPAQLAARKRFAEMARSGAFKKATKRKANPLIISAEADKSLGYYGSRGHIRKLLEDYADSGRVVSVRKKRGSNAIGVAFSGGKEVTLEKAKIYLEDMVNEGILKPSPVKPFRMNNPDKKTVSQKISQLRHEGYPQRQAVAVALSEQRAGKVKRNPSGLYAMKTQYLVSCPTTKKNMGFFDKQSDAKIYAQELADKHGMQYAISTVKVPKIQAVHFVVGESTKSFKV